MLGLQIRSITIFIVFLSCTLFSFEIGAQDSEVNTKPLTAVTPSQKLKLKSGSISQIKIDLELAKTYHAYLDKFTFKIKDRPELEVVKFELSPVVKFMDTFSKSEKEGIEGDAQLTAQIKTPVNLNKGSLPAQIEIGYQACTEKHCLFPTKLYLPVEFQIHSTELVAEKEKQPLASETNFLDFDAALEKGLITAFFVVFIAGILTSFTPCIFPMIPITLSIIGASQIRGGPGSNEARKIHSKWRGFSLSVSYVLGIAITYSILGVIAAQTGALFGAALSSPIVVMLIAIIFISLGLSMYGLFEIQMPAFIRNQIKASHSDAGYFGAFVAGLIAGVVASPCVGPVLVGILAYVAKSQSSILGFFLLFTFATGMGLLLVAVGTFSSVAAKLPRSGSWMDFVKFIFGTSMIGMAFYYLYPILPASLFYILFGVTGILIASYFGAFEPNEKLTSFTKLRKGTMVALFAMGLIYLSKGLMFEVPILLPSANLQNTEDKNSSVESDWQTYSDDAFDAAISSGTPVIIDFYADWCVSCKELEKFTFSQREVKDKLRNFSLFRVDMTVENRENAGLKEKFDIIGLPTIYFYINGQRQKDLTLAGFESKAEFLKRLEKALSKK